MKTEPNKYDIIGDIHGHHDKLTALIGRMNYTYGSKEGRKFIFLGDYIDRGPKIEETLRTVRAMVDAGEAFAIMGNHELNAILYHTRDKNGRYLRPHNGRLAKAHAATLAEFAGRDAEWAEWIEWMKRLPMFLDLGDVRAVHAAWADEHIDFLRGKTLMNGDFLRAVATKGTREHEAVEFILKGPELRLPPGVTFRDKDGVERNDIRVRWWDMKRAATFGDLAMPLPMDEITKPLDAETRGKLHEYPADAPPVFFGHYWLPARHPKLPLAHNVACLDFSGGKDGPVVGYSWEGEGVLGGYFVASDDGPGKYEVYNERWIYIDERDKFVVGRFDTYAEAVAVSKRIIGGEVEAMLATDPDPDVWTIRANTSLGPHIDAWGDYAGEEFDAVEHTTERVRELRTRARLEAAVKEGGDATPFVRAAGRFSVFADYDFNLLDEYEGNFCGDHATYAGAVDASKAIVDAALKAAHADGMTANVLLRRFNSCAPSMWISPRPEGHPRFFASRYAEERAAEICGERTEVDFTKANGEDASK